MPPFARRPDQHFDGFRDSVDDLLEEVTKDAAECPLAYDPDDDGADPTRVYGAASPSDRGAPLPAFHRLPPIPSPAPPPPHLVPRSVAPASLAPVAFPAGDVSGAFPAAPPPTRRSVTGFASRFGLAAAAVVATVGVSALIGFVTASPQAESASPERALGARGREALVVLSDTLPAERESARAPAEPAAQPPRPQQTPRGEEASPTVLTVPAKAPPAKAPAAAPAKAPPAAPAKAPAAAPAPRPKAQGSAAELEKVTASPSDAKRPAAPPRQTPVKPARTSKPRPKAPAPKPAPAASTTPSGAKVGASEAQRLLDEARKNTSASL